MPHKKKQDASFSPPLTALRKARGLNQVRLAEAVGATQRSIVYYENDDGVRVRANGLLGFKPLPNAVAAPRHHGSSGEQPNGY